MAMVKLLAPGKDYLWGGRRLIDEYGKVFAGERLAETWELSCHKDGMATIAMGEYQGKTLQEYIELRGKEILGTKASDKEQFPLLIKFIDAKKDLSIQVHPADEYALTNEGQYGKTEMWYIIDCEEDAFIYYGFEHEISKEEFEQRIKENTLLEVLNKVMVKPGDVFFIEPGTLHAIGAGNLIAEIQQNSNITYRVYDYGRKGADGKERELHIDKAVAVTQCTRPREDYSFGKHLAMCEYFTVDKVMISEEKYEIQTDDTSFVSILVLDGTGTIQNEGEILDMKKGDSIFVEAGSGKCILNGMMEVIVSTL